MSNYDMILIAVLCLLFPSKFQIWNIKFCDYVLKDDWLHLLCVISLLTENGVGQWPKLIMSQFSVNTHISISEALDWLCKTELHREISSV